MLSPRQTQVGPLPIERDIHYQYSERALLAPSPRVDHFVRQEVFYNHEILQEETKANLIEDRQNMVTQQR